MNNSYTGVINKNIYLYTFIVSIEFGFQFRYLVSYFKHWELHYIPIIKHILKIMIQLKITWEK